MKFSTIQQNNTNTIVKVRKLEKMMFWQSYFEIENTVKIFYIYTFYKNIYILFLKINILKKQITTSENLWKQ